MLNKILLPQIKDYEIATREIGNFIIEKIVSIGRNGGVIGLSGGVDSTTTAVIAKKAFDRYNQTHDEKLELVGYILPSKVNNSKDSEDGIEVAERLGIRKEVISIEPIVRGLKITNPDSFHERYRGFHAGNLMSEARAIVLHGKAATENKIVIGTGNHDEDFVIGFYTLFGDGAVNVSPLGKLSKRLVVELAKYHGFEKNAVREPDAGLEYGMTDYKVLGYRYHTVEIVGEGIRQGFGLDSLVEHEQVIPLVEKDLRDYSRVFKMNKFSSVREIVTDIFRRNKIARGKATTVHAPVAPVTLEYI